MRRLLILAPFLLAACAHTVPHTETVTVGQPFTLPVAASAAMPGDGLIQFSEVLSDSRCPRDVTCAWEGEGVVALRVSDDRGSAELQLRAPAGPPAEFGNWSVELLELRPEPREGKPLRQSDYEAVLVLRQR